MGIEIKRKDRETTQSLLRRFTRQVQQSGILIRARRLRFYDPPKSRRQKRLDALRREKLFKEREKLRKSGKLQEEVFYK